MDESRTLRLYGYTNTYTFYLFLSSFLAYTHHIYPSVLVHPSCRAHHNFDRISKSDFSFPSPLLYNSHSLYRNFSFDRTVLAKRSKTEEKENESKLNACSIIDILTFIYTFLSHSSLHSPLQSFPDDHWLLPIAIAN